MSPFSLLAMSYTLLRLEKAQLNSNLTDNILVNPIIDIWEHAAVDIFLPEITLQ